MTYEQALPGVLSVGFALIGWSFLGAANHTADNDFWCATARRLASEIAPLGLTFAATASVEEVASKVGSWFADASENTQTAILATMRTHLVDIMATMAD